MLMGKMCLNIDKWMKKKSFLFEFLFIIKVVRLKIFLIVFYWWGNIWNYIVIE